MSNRSTESEGEPPLHYQKQSFVILSLALLDTVNCCMPPLTLSCLLGSACYLHLLQLRWI